MAAGAQPAQLEPDSQARRVSPRVKKRYYDFTSSARVSGTEKLRYMHRNPVKRGLAQNVRRLGVEQLPA